MSKVQSLFWRRVTSLRRGRFRLEGVLFYWRIPLYVEKGCIFAIDVKESNSSGVGGHTFTG